MSALKRCTVCATEKPLADFPRRRSSATGRDARCRACASAYFKAHYRENRDKKLAAIQAYAERHREALLAYQREYRARNRDERLAADRRYYQENRERAAAYGRRRRAMFPEKVRLIARARNNRKRAAEGSFTPEEWTALCARYGNRCLACGRDDLPLTVDHVVPLAKGGTNWISNLQPLCKPCNCQKHLRTTDYRSRPEITAHED